MATIWQREAINHRAKIDPQGFIAEEESRYHRLVESAADTVGQRFDGRCLVLLCGPSASGKTTTAAKLQQRLRRQGREAHTVSLDDFYLGRGLAPRLPDGSFDYETVDALDLPLLHQCTEALLTRGTAQLPQFDFHTGARRPEKRTLTLNEHSIVIFEGIHALNPRLEEQLCSDAVFKISIGTFSCVFDGTQEMLTARDMRLVRRLLRDARFRNSPPANTFDMWRQVVRGEELYLLPYADSADLMFDTTHAYESSVLSGELLPLLREVPADSPFVGEATRLIEALSGFVPLSPDLLPQDGLLKEFVG